MKEHESMEQ